MADLIELRRLLERARFWLGTEHVQDWWKHNEPFRRDYAEIKKAAEESPTARTPAAHWRQDGNPDPFADRYDCERARLAMGNWTDDELANAVFLDSSIANVTAAKDRIRWLSRALIVQLGQGQMLRHACQVACDLLSERSYGSDARSPGHNARLVLEAAIGPLPKTEPIPNGVYFSVRTANFHAFEHPHVGMGTEFFYKWGARATEFPRNPPSVP